MFLVVKSIARQYLLSDEEYMYIRGMLGQPMEVATVDFVEGEKLPWCIVVRFNPTILVLFIDMNGVKYELLHDDKVIITNCGGETC